MACVLLVGKGPPDRGGIPTFMRMLVESGLTSDHQVTFLNLARDEEPQGGRLTWNNVTRLLADMVAVWRGSAGCDVVHLHSALAPSVTALRAGALGAVARVRGCRVLVHAHGGLVLTWMDRPSRRWLVRLALSPAHQVLAVSTALERALAAAAGPHRIRLLHNGVDLRAYYPEPVENAVPSVLYVGLLTPRKGLLDLFSASRILERRGVKHELVLVGGTPNEGGDAESQVRGAAPATAHLLGEKDSSELPSLYRSADVFCLPSWWEAMPLSLLEAMASGLPAVVSDVGEVPKMVAPETGVLVPPREPERLADALETLITDGELRSRMGAAARRRAVDHFALTTMVATLSTVYDDLAAR